MINVVGLSTDEICETKGLKSIVFTKINWFLVPSPTKIIFRKFYHTMSIFQNVLWRYDLPKFNQTRGFKPLNSAEVSWSTLFALVWNGGSKYDQVSLISISSCHSLPILDTLYKKVGLIFFWNCWFHLWFSTWGFGDTFSPKVKKTYELCFMNWIILAMVIQLCLICVCIFDMNPIIFHQTLF